jgi:acetyl-CoA C-acetyltransferase
LAKGRALCSIISAGCTTYGKRQGLSGADLFNEALCELFENCPRLESSDIDALYLGRAFESFERGGNLAASYANNFGFQSIPAVRVETVSSSGGSAVRQGVLGILSGQHDVVICAGVEKMTNTSDTEEALEIISMASDRPLEQWNGATLAALNAIAAHEHMEKFGTTEKQLALVSVKNHKNALENPKAYLRRKVSVEDVLASRRVATPLKLLDCSPICDGASAVALCRSDLAAKFIDAPVDVLASAEATDGDFVYRKSLTEFNATKVAAKKAFDMSGLQVPEIDLLELHDAFTINEIIAYEDIGLCEKGRGGKFIEDGRSEVGGEIPVNASGGLKAKGHPVGASGVGQIFEVYEQLTDKVSGSRRVEGAKTGLTHSMGGAGVSAVVHILQRRR